MKCIPGFVRSSGVGCPGFRPRSGLVRAIVETPSIQHNIPYTSPPILFPIYPPLGRFDYSSEGALASDGHGNSQWVCCSMRSVACMYFQDVMACCTPRIPTVSIKILHEPSTAVHAGF